jgi:hypothetical protein
MQTLHVAPSNRYTRGVGGGHTYAPSYTRAETHTHSGCYTCLREDSYTHTPYRPLTEVIRFIA